jgi:high-affinity nickel-transport protein
METSLTSASVFAVLGLGLVFGLKHATEVDHVVAVSTLVSEHRNVWRSALVGGLWGAGHTASLLVVGVFVLVFRIAIPLRVANWLEFCVALMIIGLGVLAVTRVLRRRSAMHIHRHLHRHGADEQSHLHIHFHEHGTPAHDGAPSSRLSRATQATKASHSHAISRLGFRPLLVGAMHGLAGSAALTLLVLTQIQSVSLGLLYLVVFGLGSTLGMLLMSGLIGLPFAFSGRSFTRVASGLQAVAGSLSITFGLWYAYQVAIN